MSISIEDVKHIAKLANLDFTNEQIQHLQRDSRHGYSVWRTPRPGMPPARNRVSLGA